MGYWLYTPNNYTKDKKWPLVIFMHGDGGWGKDKLNKLLTAGDLAGHLKGGANYDAIAIEPQFDWPGNSELLILKNKLIPYLIENYNVDTDKISLIGGSSGAGRVIHTALKYPEYFSCLVTISLCERDSSWGKKLAKEKYRAFHGDSDTVCSKENSIRLVNYVSSAGGYAKLTILKGVGHSASSPTLNNYKIVNWMINQTRGQPVQN
jgi:predicted peptidase